MAEILQRYRDWQPTAYDPCGYCAEDDQLNWFVIPLIQTRDSGPLDRSNFKVATEWLENCKGLEEEVDWTIYRFNHWGPGWFEIILVKPGTEAQSIAEEIKKKVLDYPVLDEEDYSNTSYEEYLESWENYGRNEFVYALISHFDLSDIARDLVEDAPHEEVDKFFTELDISSGEYWDTDSGVHINIDGALREMDRSDMAKFIKHLRSLMVGG